MPESDVSKMKVADLKRELKLRGLAVTGNKTELQDRLQTALIDGELSLEDTAISGEELLDEDAVLTDEDEAKILGADENELLKSPTTTPVTAPDLTSHKAGGGGGLTDDDALDMPTTPTASKKIVLKRKNSFTSAAALIAAPTAKENTEPSPAKASKTSERKLITVDDSEKKDTATHKVAQLSLQERLELRAKKFGTTKESAGSGGGGKTTTAGGTDSTTSDVIDEKQIEMLKKRAERFGCVESTSKIAKLDADEKLQKRKERFGGGGGGGTDTGASLTSSKTTDEWAEKARQRLERFKATAPPTAAATSTATAAAAVSE